MKRLYLSIVVTVPSEEGQKRIDKALEKNNIDFIEGVYVDEYGRSREKYGDLGINPPEGFTEAEKAFRKSFLTSEINENGEIFLEKDELEYEFYDYLLPIKNIIDITDNPEIGSTIILKNGMSVHVSETVEDINEYLYILEMSWFKRLKLSISNFFKKNKQ
jgi:hypothetical protein